MQTNWRMSKILYRPKYSKTSVIGSIRQHNILHGFNPLSSWYCFGGITAKSQSLISCNSGTSVYFNSRIQGFWFLRRGRQSTEGQVKRFAKTKSNFWIFAQKTPDWLPIVCESTPVPVETCDARNAGRIYGKTEQDPASARKWSSARYVHSAAQRIKSVSTAKKRGRCFGKLFRPVVAPSLRSRKTPDTNEHCSSSVKRTKFTGIDRSEVKRGHWPSPGTTSSRAGTHSTPSCPSAPDTRLRWRTPVSTAGSIGSRPSCFPSPDG